MTTADWRLAPWATVPPSAEHAELLRDHFHPGRPGFKHPRTYIDGVGPLWHFPIAQLERILADCAGPKPDRWHAVDGGRMESRAFHEWHWTRGRHLVPDPDYVPRYRRKIPAAIRRQVFERDGWACRTCQAKDELSIDHIYPHALGGSDEVTNLQTLCRSCNSRKGARV